MVWDVAAIIQQGVGFCRLHRSVWLHCPLHLRILWRVCHGEFSELFSSLAIHKVKRDHKLNSYIWLVPAKQFTAGHIQSTAHIDSSDFVDCVSIRFQAQPVMILFVCDVCEFPVQCSGPSMEPTIINHDIVFSERLSRCLYRIEKWVEFICQCGVYVLTSELEVSIWTCVSVWYLLFQRGHCDCQEPIWPEHEHL